jgi:hypothetical protein
MKKSKVAATVATITATVSTLALAAAPAKAWTHRRSAAYPQFYAPRYYSSPHPVRYYRVCGYGDCPCLRSVAIRTGSRVWWDRYDACTG